MHHHALREHAGERLVHADMTGGLHGAGEEAAVQKMQDRVLDAADILVDRHQAVHHGACGRSVFVPRIGEAREVPRRIDESVHGVGFALRLSPALRTGDVLPGRMMVERVAGLVERDILRQHHRQILVGHRHHTACRAVDHRNRAAPVALPRDTPVAQAKIHLALADRHVAPHLSLEPLRYFFFRLFDGHAIEEARIDHAAIAIVSDVGDDERLRVDVGRAHHRRIAEPVFIDKIEVALVVRGAAEDGAGAVFHQYEIGDVDRQFPVRIERVDRLDAGIEPKLLGGIDDFLRGAVTLRLRDEFRELLIFCSGGLRQRMIRRDRHEFCAEQRVMPRRENFQLALAIGRGCGIEREADQHALGAPDPVALHQPHLVGPAIQRIERVQQFLRIVGDLEDPLVHLALFDDGAGAPAATVDHLLVGEHGHVDRVPVELALLALGQPRAQKIEKQLLLMLVIRGVAGREFA